MPQQAEQRKTLINVTELASDLKKFTLKSGKDKYFFWMFKQDGNKTKAFEGFEQLSIQIGKSYEAEVEFEEKEFVNEKGKNIKFTSRKILFFYTASPGFTQEATRPATTPQATSTPSFDQVALERRIKESFEIRDARIAELEKKVDHLININKEPELDDVNF
jgi:hypothetical protein